MTQKKKRIRLDKNAVVQAAAKLVNAEGMEALTLSRLAEELGIQTPSLYNHIEGLPGLQKELAVLNAKNITECMSESAIGKSGRDLFVEVAQAFREYIKSNAGLYMSTLRSAGAQSTPDPNLLHEEERGLKVGTTLMSSLGLQGEDAIHGLRAFRSVTHGFATLEAAGGFGLPQDCDESFRRLIEALVAGLKR